MSEFPQVMPTPELIESFVEVEELHPRRMHPVDRRIVDRVFAFAAVVALSPIFILAVLGVLMGSGWPAFFKQERVGKDGKTFWLLKFRTMRRGKQGPAITARGDSRITVIGKFLRKFKLDELPQLWNVVRGEMSIVGPRPEVPQFVDVNSPVWRSVLQVRPGITDPASIAFRNEEAILARAADPISFYKKTILPAKLKLNLAYLEKRSLWLDTIIVFETARCAMFPNSHNGKEIGL